MVQHLFMRQKHFFCVFFFFCRINSLFIFFRKYKIFLFCSRISHISTMSFSYGPTEVTLLLRKKGWSLKILLFIDISIHALLYQFGGKMLARSLKNIWTDEILVDRCSAEDKMVSNHITVLQSCFMYSIILSLWAELSVSLAAASVWFHIHNVYCFYTKRVFTLQGFPWVGLHLEMWSCPTGYRSSYLVLEGG